MLLDNTIKRIIGVGLACWLCCSCSKDKALNPDTESARLSQEIVQFVEQPDFDQAQWGISVVDVATGCSVIDYHNNKFFIPASAVKLITAGLTLDQLGPEKTIKTSLYSSESPNSRGELPDLILLGRGDPTLTSSTQPGYASLEALVDQLVSQDVRTIEGDLIVDDSYFYAPSWGKGWEREDSEFYFATAFSALMVDHNVLCASIKPAAHAGKMADISFENAEDFIQCESEVLTVAQGEPSEINWEYNPSQMKISFFGTVTEGDSPKLQIGAKPGELKLGNDYATEFATYHLLNLLEKKGVILEGNIRIVSGAQQRSDYTEFPLLAEVQSPPVKLIAHELLRNSLYNSGMELLALQIGAKRDVPSTVAEPRKSTPLLASEVGIEALTMLDINPFEMYLTDASGLSRLNKVTPRAMTQYLTNIRSLDWYPYFYEILPRGTEHWFVKKNEALTLAQKDSMRVKGGTMTGEYSLVGYLTTQAGQELAFAFFLNNFDKTNKSITPTEAMNTMVSMLANERKML